MKWILTIFMSVTLLGCRPDISCEDTGCAFGYVCDPASGDCALQISDCRVVDKCLASEVCDVSAGICRPQALLCADGNPCPSGLVCNAQSGFCEPAYRCSIDGCPAAEVCDISTDRCRPKPCLADTECPGGFICDETCRVGCRPGSNVCGPGESCLVQTGDDFGTCQPRCQQDRDCPFGQFCEADEEISSCKLEPPCLLDEDCRSDEQCRNQLCVQPPCQSDEDCLESQVCEIPTGTCIQVNCDEDVYGSGTTREPNHDRTTAFPLAAAAECAATPAPRCVYEDLAICRGRSDWFSVRTLSNELLRIRVDQLTLEHDLDLYVFDDAGNLIAQNTLLTPITTLRVGTPRTQNLFIEIRPTTFQAAKYVLTVVREFCDNDIYEENDSLAQATMLNTSPDLVSEIRAKTCGLDEDWFVLPALSRDQGLVVERTVSEASLLMEVLTPDGHIEPLLRGQNLEFLRLESSGNYYIRALSGLGLTTDYRFNFSVRNPWQCPGSGEHNSPQTARLLGPSFEETTTLCPFENFWDIHWWTLNGPTSRVKITVIPGESTPPLQVVLLHQVGEDSPTPLRTAMLTNGQWEIESVVPASGNVLLRVASDAPTKSLKTAPTYRILYESVP